MKIGWGKIGFQLFLLIGGLGLVLTGSTNGIQTHQEIATLQPDFTIQSNVYEGDVDIISSVWLTADSQPVPDAVITSTLYNNLNNIRTTQVIASEDGSFSLELNYTDILPGNYSWEIKFRKEGYQVRDLIENVVLVPHNLNVRIDAAPELVQGENFIIVSIVTFTSVGADKFGQPVSNVDVIFQIQLIYEDGVLSEIVKIAKTNQNGVAVITLSADETKSLKEVGSIIAEIQEDEQYSAASTEIANLPIVIDSDKSFLDRTLEFLEKNTVLLAFMTVFFASSTIILLLTRNKISLKQKMWPKNEK